MADLGRFEPRRPEELLRKLTKSIMRGDADSGQALELLERVERTGANKQLLHHREGEDQSLLHLAAKFHSDSLVIRRLLKLCPQLLLVTRSDQYEGQTALHIAISKGNLAAAKAMLSKTVSVESSERSLVLHQWARGDRFRFTVMMGELPLTVAALSVNRDMATLLLERGAKMVAQNSRGDTVFHSLIRFAHFYPEKIEDMLAMSKFLHEKMVQRQMETDRTGPERQMDSTDPSAIWFLTNKDGATPLQLAAHLGEVEMFQFILNLENVYCSLDEHDGLFDIHLFDITEIDNVALQKFSAQPKVKRSGKALSTPVDFGGLKPTPEVRTEDCCEPREAGSDRPRTQQSVLDSICLVDINRAFQLINTPVIKHIIKQKWAVYRYIYYVWGFLHLTYMILLTFCADVKTNVIIERVATVNNITGQVTWIPAPATQTEKNFVLAMVIINIIVAVVMTVREFVHYCIQRKRWHLSQVHHNGLYRLILVCFALSLLLDSLWYLISPDNNYGIVLALLLGWWFLTFFLRAFLKFSFFTVMLQKVLLGDMTRFGTIIGIVLTSFSVAMYITFKQTQPPVPEFADYPSTLILMFKLMLGLADIEVLYQAHHPWVAVALFVAFVLLTYLLMLNALIAMMSQTCALVSENKYTQWELQRLSIILYIEAMLPSCCQKLCGKPKTVRVFDIQRSQLWAQQRYFSETMSLQTSVADGNAIIKRRALLQTLGFDNLNLHFHPRHHGASTFQPGPEAAPASPPPDPASPQPRRRRSSRRRRQLEREEAEDGGAGHVDTAESSTDRLSARGRQRARGEREEEGGAQGPGEPTSSDRLGLLRRPSGRVRPVSAPHPDCPQHVQLHPDHFMAGSRRGVHASAGLLSSRSYDSSGVSPHLETIRESQPEVTIVRIPQSEA